MGSYSHEMLKDVPKMIKLYSEVSDKIDNIKNNGIRDLNDERLHDALKDICDYYKIRQFYNSYELAVRIVKVISNIIYKENNCSKFEAIKKSYEYIHLRKRLMGTEYDEIIEELWGV